MFKTIYIIEAFGKYYVSVGVAGFTLKANLY